MSLAGLKNLFFHQTITPVPMRTNSNYDWSNASREPLLQPNNSQAHEPIHTNEYDEDTDVESQQSIHLKNEKADKKKGFRIDARVISDATIGLSDGLTVPFALTAGLSALGNTNVVIYGGLAELIAGAISMGLGGYLGAKSEAASYHAQREETQLLVDTNPRAVVQSVASVFEPYELPKQTLQDLSSHLAESPHLVDFIMQFQHCEEPPASSRALTSALTIALGYFFGGLLPLMPYFFVGSDQVYEGLYISIGVMVVALFLFGYIKTCVVVGFGGGKCIRAGCLGGIQMVVVGSLAAGAAMGLVKLFDSGEGKTKSA
ncbi:related to CCC1 Proposed vacuolar iron transport protein [Phialocephala subalpina]|uniref:Related to CCC1 Proposed vacuolar iron transport protein n=1 Tax=Phialocephala subalpina TaxID=576137 RepID=A0A1L7X7D8_9HELO|nr:related to CCC1 Proposed vacuolar iron transport protein [Phialocephala subalpina]